MNSLPHATVIRPMRAGDIDWAKELADGSPEAPHWPREAYLAAIDGDGWPRRIAVVAEYRRAASEAGSFPVKMGFAVASFVPPESELETVVVDPAGRRSGLGRALIAAVADGLKSANVTEVTLEVRASNERARSFYLASGFSEAGRRLRYYADPIEDAILMRLALG